MTTPALIDQPMLPTILIVEDDSDALHSLRRCLTDAGYRAVCAVTGSQALQLAMLQYPAAIFLDVRLPDMDGVSLAERLRELPNLAETPIVFLTGRIDSHVLLATRWMRHTALLRKPCGVQDVIKTLEESLQSGDAPRGDEFCPSELIRNRRTPATEARSGDPVATSGRVIPAHQTRNGEESLSAADEHTEHSNLVRDLVDDVAHDARSTIFVVSEFAAQSAIGLDGPEYQEHRRMLHVIEDRMLELRLLIDLLDVGSRLDEVVGACDRQTVETRQLLDAIAADCERLCHRKACRLSTSIDEPELGTLVDSNSARVALAAAFIHALSLAESSSAIYFNVIKLVRRGEARAQIAIRVQTLTGRPPATALPSADDACLDSCDIGRFPKLAVASEALRRRGGALSVQWCQRSLSIIVQVPIQEAVGEPATVGGFDYASTYLGD